MFMSAYEIVERRLAALKWTWADLARKLDTNDQRLHNWKKRGVPRGMYPDLAKALGISADDFSPPDGEQAKDAANGYAWGGALLKKIMDLPPEDKVRIAAIVDTLHAMAHADKNRNS